VQEDYRAAPLAALDGLSVSAELHFLRSHFPPPAVDAEWTLEVGGAVARPLALAPADVARFGEASHHVVLECAGHRRTELSPPVEGLPWGAGAVSQGLWTGAPLARVLAEAEPLPEAAYVVLTGADGDGAFARAISLAKARDEATLLAWALDGSPVPLELGGPLRAVVPGHYAVDSVKWLRRIEVTSEPFRGHFQAADYCLFDADGVEDGTQLAELPATSLVTVPEAGERLDPGAARIAGVAWGGRGPIATVEVSVDGGSWHASLLREPLGPYAFVPWELTLDLDAGERTIASRATDAEGNVQPEQPLWNRRGYANSSVHRIAVTIGGSS
jgi:DMSO/TMAO reductase YedYZ molybdopterin-dependent catalytic subunit